MSMDLDQMIDAGLRAQSQAVPDAGFTRKVAERTAEIRSRRKLARVIPGLITAIGTALVLLFQVRWTALPAALARLTAFIPEVQWPQWTQLAQAPTPLLPMWAWGCLFVALFAAASSAIRTSEA
jgi:hypothetical protein